MVASETGSENLREGSQHPGHLTNSTHKWVSIMAKRRFEVLCRQFPNLAPENIVCVLIHVPKTGGRSLRYWLNEYFPIWNIQSTKDARTNPPEGRYVIYTGHSSPDILIGPRLLAPQVANGLTSIAVVRNPYDRAVSLFHHFVRHGVTRTHLTTFSN